MAKRRWKLEKQKVAVALRYRMGKDQAPRVVAKGRGNNAEKILSLAREHQVPLYEDEALVSLLMKVEVDQAIPPELYRVVAEVLSMVYRMEKRAELLRREGGR